MRYPHLLSIVVLAFTIGCAGTDAVPQAPKVPQGPEANPVAAQWERSVRQQIPSDAQVFAIIPDVGRLGLGRALDTVALVPWLPQHRQAVIDNAHTLVTEELQLNVRNVHAIAAFVRMGKDGWQWGLAAGPIDSATEQLPSSCTLTEQLLRCGTAASATTTTPVKALSKDVQVWASIDASAVTTWFGGPSMLPQVDKIELRISDTQLTIRAYGSDAELRRLEQLVRDSLGTLGTTAMYGVSRIMSMMLSPFIANIREQLQANYSPGTLTLSVPVSSGGALLVVAGGAAWFTGSSKDSESVEMAEPVSGSGVYNGESIPPQTP